MKRAFVTGGSGFVGGRLIEVLRERGALVMALARSDNSAKTVEALGAKAVRGDLADIAAMQTGMSGCDVVFHCAAHTDQFDPLRVHEKITTEGTRNTLEAARAAKVKRFVHVSTEAVLADGKPIIKTDETRALPAKPMGAYPITKGQAERIVLAARDIETVIVRPRFVWGRGDTNLLPEFVDAVKAGKFVWIGGGHYLTSTTHVDNCVEGLLLAAERGKPGEIYFVTDGSPSEFRTFITRLLATAGVTAPDKSIPHWLAHTVVVATMWMKKPPLTRTAFSLMAHEVTVDDSKARRELAYVGKKSLDEGFAEMAT